MIVKRNKKEDRKLYSYDLNDNGKHLLLTTDEKGYFYVSLYYDDKNIILFEDDFEIKRDDNTQIYNLFNELYEEIEKKEGYKLFDSDNYYFDTFESTISIGKETDKYLLTFTKDYGRISNMCDAPLINNCYENEEFERLFTELQMYDPNYHQISMDEYTKVLKKTK